MKADMISIMRATIDSDVSSQTSLGPQSPSCHFVCIRGSLLNFQNNDPRIHTKYHETTAHKYQTQMNSEIRGQNSNCDVTGDTPGSNAPDASHFRCLEF